MYNIINIYLLQDLDRLSMLEKYRNNLIEGAGISSAKDISSSDEIRL